MNGIPLLILFVFVENTIFCLCSCQIFFKLICISGFFWVWRALDIICGIQFNFAFLSVKYFPHFSFQLFNNILFVFKVCLFFVVVFFKYLSLINLDCFIDFSLSCFFSFALLVTNRYKTTEREIGVPQDKLKLYTFEFALCKDEQNISFIKEQPCIFFFLDSFRNPRSRRNDS